MRQQVNLFFDAHKRKNIFFSSGNVFLMLIFLIIFLGVYSYFEVMALKKITVNNEMMVNNIKLLDEKIKAHSVTPELAKRRDDLVFQVKKLTLDIAHKEAIQSIYGKHAASGYSGFSRMMKLMGEYSAGDFFVKEIGFYQGGAEVVINGFSSSAALVLDYMESLKKEDSFKRAKFGLLSVEKNAVTGLMDFSMLREVDFEKH